MSRDEARESYEAALDRLAAQKNEPEMKEWRAIRIKAGQDLDPETAEVMFLFAQTLDPYGICRDFPEELDSIGREYFARAMGSDIWVSFDDLSTAKIARLRERMAAGDFSPPAILEPMSLQLIRRYANLGHCYIGPSRFEIHELIQLLDGSFKLIIRQDLTSSDLPGPRIWERPVAKTKAGGA